jgi:hypothetical protein
MDIFALIGVRCALAGIFVIHRTVHRFLLLLAEHPQFDPFIIHGIGAMIRDTRTLCSFSIENIVDIVTHPPPEAQILPRFSLYFATTAVFPDSSPPDLLPLLMSAVQPIELVAALRSLIDFSEIAPHFFAPYLDEIVRWTCAITDHRRPFF